MNPNVSIIIVNYNVKDLLEACLASIYKFTVGCSFEIIVIDNNSSDESVLAVKKIFPDVILIENGNNAGFPEANNQGMRIAKGEFIFLLNPDTELLEDSLTILMDYLRNNPDVTLLAPKLLNADRTVQRSIYRFPRLKYLLAEMFYLESLTQDKYYSEKNTDNVFEVESAAGAALFCRRELINRIGVLNPSLFWIEDIDYCYRIAKAGGKVVYFPNTKIIHYSGQSAKKNYNVSISNQIINKIKFYKIHKLKIELFLVYLLSLSNVIMRLLIFSVLAPFRKIYFLKMKAYWFTLPAIFTATDGIDK